MTTEFSTAPFDDGSPPQGVDLACETGHTARIYLSGMTAQMARDYAGMLDGTSPMYVVDPRAPGQDTFIGHCKDCGALFRATPFGYEEN
jgi:hypothetical protein